MPDNIELNGKFYMNYKRLFIPNSLVFITFVTKNRKNILHNNISLLRQAFKLSKERYKYTIVAITVNPNHVHMILKVDDIYQYPKIVGYIKSSFTKLLNIEYSLNQNREANIWQRRYWEHTILSEQDLYKHIDYIHFNSTKHYGVAPKDWKYSSFMKFVDCGYYELSWCNIDDKNKINAMNLE